MQDEEMILNSILNGIQFHLEEENYIQGNYLFNACDVCDSIIIILEGKVKITILDENDQDFTLDYLQ
jgi:CRP-like cAMP-binding protein